MASVTKVSVNAQSAAKALAAITKLSMPSQVGPVVKKCATIWQGQMVVRTPKRWTGQTRKGWKVEKAGAANKWDLTNKNKVMGWLEMGTKAHGPVQAKMLFIPLTRKAASAGARGVMNANRQHATKVAFGVHTAKKKLPFIYGKDFVFAKRVRGIKAMHIVAQARPLAEHTLEVMLRTHFAPAFK